MSLESGWNTDPKIFNEVTAFLPSDKTLFRSQAPHYPGYDDTQKLNEDDIKFLKDREFNGIISFNQYPYNDASKKLLQEASIELLHRSVVDFKAQSMDDFEKVNKFFKGRKKTLMHCGYGHGRTGTGVTALQLYHTKGNNPTTEEVRDGVNHIEEQVQKDALEDLRKKIQFY